MIGLENFKYSFKDTLKENTGLSVYRTGYEKCCPDHQWGPGVRDHYLVHYVSSGEGTYCCGGQTYVLHEGDLFTIFPAQVVEYHAAEKTPWEYYWVGFNGADAHRMVSMAGFSPDSPVQHAADPAIREALLRIYRASGNTPSADVAMAGYLQLFLAQLIRCNGDAAGYAGRGGYLAQALRYIQHNYGGDISVSDIADFVGVSLPRVSDGVSDVAARLSAKLSHQRGVHAAAPRHTDRGAGRGLGRVQRSALFFPRFPSSKGLHADGVSKKKIVVSRKNDRVCGHFFTFVILRRSRRCKTHIKAFPLSAGTAFRRGRGDRGRAAPCTARAGRRDRARGRSYSPR